MLGKVRIGATIVARQRRLDVAPGLLQEVAEIGQAGMGTDLRIGARLWGLPIGGAGLVGHLEQPHHAGGAPGSRVEPGLLLSQSEGQVWIEPELPGFGYHKGMELLAGHRITIPWRLASASTSLMERPLTFEAFQTSSMVYVVAPGVGNCVWPRGTMP